MIIFNFGPLSKDELTIRFDVEGAKIFLMGISNFPDKKNDSITIDCLRYFGRAIGVAEIEIIEESENRLETKGARVTFFMTEEAVEYAQFMLENFLVDGDFSPSEFYGFSRVDRKYDTQVFFTKFSSIESVISTNGRQ